MRNITVRSQVVAISIAIFVIVGCAASSLERQPANPESQIVEIESRKGVVQKIILMVPENPVASIVLLPGNNGKLELSEAFGRISIGWLGSDFLVRNRKRFAENGFIVAVVDAPSDRQTGKREISGGLNGMTKDNEMFRMCDAHAQDIAAVVSYLKSVKDVPAWIVGTSMGTISAVNAAIRAEEIIDGLILTSSKTQTGPEWGPIFASHPNAIADMALQKIKVPTLIVHHKNDTCASSAFDALPEITKGLINSTKVEVFYATGGKPGTEGCTPFGAHAFYGIDEEIFEIIAHFILSDI